MTRPSPSPDVIVVGAGVAGASLAYHLARRGAGNVLVLEREPVPGLHASGRNAAMFYALVRPPEIAELAARSRPFLLDPPAEVASQPLLRPMGSLTLLGEHQTEEATRKLTLAARLGLRARALRFDEIAKSLPALSLRESATAVACEDDGLLDIAALLQGLLRGACTLGARVELGQEVQALRVEDGRVTGVETSDGPIACAIVVDAAGAWAGMLGAERGATRPPLVPCRRHLLFVRAPSRPGPLLVDDRGPFYLRPEAGGYLASPCDEDPHPAGIPGVDPLRVAEGMDGIARRFPALASAPLVRSWACLRTRTPDERFVIGPDPVLPSYFWMAGLGGHGMTAGVAAGELAAELMCGEGAGTAWAAPSRFRVRGAS